MKHELAQAPNFNLKLFISGLSRICIVIILFSSCHKISGEGPLVSETRSTGQFEGIDMAISGVLKYTPDSVFKVEIKAQQNIQNLIETSVINNQLIIGLKRDTRLGSYKPVEVSVHAPDINSLKISGSANAFILKPLNTEGLSLAISGSGDIHTDSLTTPQMFLVKISGSGSVYVKSMKSNGFKLDISGSGNMLADIGTTTDEQLSISGSGKVDISSVESQNASIRSSGSGDVRLHANEKLDVHISGSGNIYYKGNPKITSEISGSGKIIPF